MRVTAALSLPILLCAVSSCASGSTHRQTVVLVTEEEAAQPDTPPETPRGACSETGPGIEVRSPADGQSYPAPLPVEVRFTPSAGARIDLSRIRVRLLKGPLGFDLTGRARPFLSEQGVSMPRADLPRGTHRVEITVADTAGRSCSAIVSFTVI
jgi:hypothetical protein